MEFYYKYKKYKGKYKYLNGGSKLGYFIESGSTGEVYNFKDDNNRVIKKGIALDGRITAEINNYKILEKYQGIIVPKIYLKDSNSSELVLDKLQINIYQKLKNDTIELNKILILQIIYKINFLNTSGYCHNDLKFQNIGIKDKEVLLFDLEDMSNKGYESCQNDDIFKSLLQLLLEYLNEDNIDEYDNLLELIELRGTDIYDDDYRVLLKKKKKLVEYHTSKLLTKEESLAFLEAEEKIKKPSLLDNSSSSSSSDSDEDDMV